MPFIQPTIGPTPESTTVAGKTIIVTGANSGLGLETARQYILLHASRIIIAVRSVDKGKDAVKLLTSDPQVKAANPNVSIEVMKVDLDDTGSVYAFAQKVKQELDSLDILLLNGGVVIMNYETSANGHERVIQVNYHSNALLALLLLPLLESTAAKKGQPSRLTFVGSVTMGLHTLKKEPLLESETMAQRFDDKSRYASFNRYSDSKLMIAAFTQELASHVSANKVIVNNLCPGMVATDFDKHLGFMFRGLMTGVRKIRARSVETGARTYVYATSVAGKESHGTFISSNKITE
ncbi:MAG: hypothetical protein Q9195_002850 [Heterodermia aff. obscurata]